MESLPESFRRRLAETEQQDPLHQVRELLSEFADAESFEEVEARFRQLATVTTLGIVTDLRALETVLSGPIEPGLPTRLVAWDANWVLDEANDENSLEFLRKAADMLRAVLASVENP